MLGLFAFHGLTEDAIIQHLCGFVQNYRRDDEIPQVVLDIDGPIGSSLSYKLHPMSEDFLARRPHEAFRVYGVKASAPARRQRADAMALGASLRETLAKYVPTWLGNVPGLRNLYSTLWTVALLGDGMRQWAWEGQLATYPGVGTPTALPYIGASRGLLQGPAEPNATFAARCINWLTAIQQMGSPLGIVQEVQAYLIGQGNLGAGVYPVVSLVDRAGHIITANADQSITRSLISWTGTTSADG
jgi:hypothetical protein